MDERILQALASSLTEGSIYGLVALGLVIILRSTGALFFAQGAAAVALGMHLGLSTATNTKRDLSIVRTGVIPIGRPIRGVPALMEIMA